MNLRRGFTLIELLVVIAIIAILAAILFPVFAQAKLAAKGAASLSDAYEQGLAEVMYTNDYDDTFTPAATWEFGATANGLVCFAGPACASPWPYLVLPYIKNGDIFNDPLAQGNFTSTNPLANDLYNPTYALDFAAVAPWGGPTPSHTYVVTTTAPKQPANTVLMVAKYSDKDIPNDPTGSETYGFFPGPPDDGPLYNSVVDPPNCGFAFSACISSWGLPDAGFNPWAWQQILGNVTGGAPENGQPENANAIAEGENTGGMARRANGMAIVILEDSHARKMSAGALAAGTNWSDQTPEAMLKFTTADGSLPSNYMWASPMDGG